MLKAVWCPYRLQFRFEARTSRQTMTVKDTYFIRVTDSDDASSLPSYGECALFRGLSADDRPDYEQKLAEACRNPLQALGSEYSSIRFGFESALRGHAASAWSRGDCGMPINGLIWMGDKHTMRQRIAEKIDAGFRVLKLKIGGISFDDETDLLAEIRRHFPASELEIRLDANGSFSAGDALSRLDALSAFGIHSLEQPVRAGQPEVMADICRRSPVPIALDEELIGFRTREESEALIGYIRPQYIILKPSLCGGLEAADTYIDIARSLGIGWWATSALESNVGLEAIAMWLSQKEIDMPQGLGTGQLYFNNIDSPLRLRGSALWYDAGAPAINLEDMAWRD